MLSSQGARSSARGPHARASPSRVQVSPIRGAGGEAQRRGGPGAWDQDGQQEVPELPEEQAVQWGLEEILPAQQLLRARDTGA